MNERPWIQPDRHTSRRAGVGRLVLLPPFGATVSVAVCMLGMALAATALPAQVTYIDREYQIKAAYLYHLIKYVRWPETSRLASQNAGKSPFVITVLGQNPFGGSLKHIAATRRIRGRPIRLEFVQNPDAIPDCHIVFVPATTSEKFRQSVLRETADRPILVVGESAGFAEAGAMINFYVEENRVKFEINTEAASRVGLSFSAKLLQIGRRVATTSQANSGGAKRPLRRTEPPLEEKVFGTLSRREQF